MIRPALRALYEIFHCLALPAIYTRLWLKSRKNRGYAEHWQERLGFPSFHLNGPSIWIHAVSLGESIAAQGLISALITQYPAYSIVVTHMTPTGRASIQNKFGRQVFSTYLPYDVSWCLHRFIHHIHPKILIIMETELWPNLLAVTHELGIPSLLANARLSERSYQRYARFGCIARSMLNHLSVIGAQAPEDQLRFQKLAPHHTGIHLLGNLKFDITLPSNQTEKIKALQSKGVHHRPIWIAASTHPGEEEIILSAHRQLLKTHPTALLILVPRHPERFPHVKNLIQSQDFSVVSKSSQDPITPETQVLLGDSMGELMMYYGLSDVAFVGGSLIPRGGHNPLEPISLGVPVITGPYHFNFQSMMNALKQQEAILEVTSAESLSQQVLRLFESKELRATLSQRGLELLQENKGSTQRHLDEISILLPENSFKNLDHNNLYSS